MLDLRCGFVADCPIMGALKDLWQSERGLVAIVLIVSCTVLAVTGRITVDQWLEYTKWLFVTYAAAKTVTGTAAILTKPDPSAPKSDPAGDLLGSLLREFTAAQVSRGHAPAPQPNNPPPQDIPGPAPGPTPL